MTVFEQFNYPYWERVHYWPSWFKVIFLIGVSTVIFAIEYGLLLNPVLKKYETQVQLEYELMSQLRHDWEKLVNLKTLKQQINFLKKRVHERLIFLPPNDVRSPFLQYLAAHKTNLKLRYYYPAPILHHKFYSEQLIRLSLIGSYEEIIAFLISMNQPRNQMTIKEIKLLLLKKDSKNQVKLKLNISAYVHYRD